MKDAIGMNDILSYLIQALDLNGDFPIEGKIVNRAQEIIREGKSVSSAVELILQEPALAARLLHLSNNEKHHKEFPVLTITQAVSELGDTVLEDILYHVAQRQGFRDKSDGNDVFRLRLQQAVVIRLLTSMLMKSLGFEDNERSQISSMLLALGPILLSYYFPQVYESGIQRAHARQQSLNKSIQETLGIDPYGISIGIVHSMNIPDFYREALSGAYQIYPGNANLTVDSYLHPLMRALSTATWCADLLFGEVRHEDLDRLLIEIERKLEIDSKTLRALLLELPQEYERYCQNSDLRLGPLANDQDPQLGSGSTISTVDEIFAEAAENSQLTYFIREIEIAAKDASSIANAAAAAMEALAFALSFDRVLLFLPGELPGSVKHSIALGAIPEIELDILANSSDHGGIRENPTLNAFLTGTLQSSGAPLFENGRNFIALPVGGVGRTQGVIYADFLDNDLNSQPLLDSSVEHGLSVLAKALDRAVRTRSV